MSYLSAAPLTRAWDVRLSHGRHTALKRERERERRAEHYSGVLNSATIRKRVFDPFIGFTKTRWLWSGTPGYLKLFVIRLQLVRRAATGRLLIRSVLWRERGAFSEPRRLPARHVDEREAGDACCGERTLPIASRPFG